MAVAYAAKHGTAAEDGSGANSPFAEAMLASLEELGLEINFLFRRVRDQVLARTNRRQEPVLYGSLPTSLYSLRRSCRTKRAGIGVSLILSTAAVGTQRRCLNGVLTCRQMPDIVRGHQQGVSTPSLSRLWSAPSI